jgi:hypothetical protein
MSEQASKHPAGRGEAGASGCQSTRGIMTQEWKPVDLDLPEGATELAEKLRQLARSDPGRAADLVAQLVSALDVATGGALTGQFEQATEGAGAISANDASIDVSGESSCNDEDRSDKLVAMTNVEATGAPVRVT